MTRMIRFLTLVSLFLISTTSVFAQQTYIHAGQLFDGTGNDLRENVTIIINGNSIEGVENGFLELGDETMLIDLSNNTVLPGLIDLHVHLEGETNPNRYLETFTMDPEERALRSVMFARRTLEAGFTTVRDLGGTGVNTSLRNAIAAGYVDGPRVISVGKSLATTGGHADPTNSFKRDLMGNS